ncbi:hypothetical protein H4S14_003125 [Agrobacterium vitis]|uniref:DUF4160 domain-containing protein n=1 Tax=Rhizobium oryziradicis TaxID=1867956 RepID=A0A1Q8ZTA7_9HYPH|nr:DUF4160 domain-containing protein [Rhizobium oryziradicis]MBB4955025.1 hypothetical protein [Agrobacterium vitis]MBE1439362.1 hypothetical protein [Agrobacterium vitis]OLP45321.1 hypothetical protein BJF95_18620 [Rhizobium oryziradicis]
MPTVLRKYGFRFHFYTADGHEPPHIHVDGSGGEAKVWLMDGRLAKVKGFNQREIARILEVVEENRKQMLEAWHDYFG